MTAAVTGANGHIGNNLCRELIKNGYNVKALVRDDIESLKDVDVVFVKGNIINKKGLWGLIKNADVIFHLAAVISINGNQKHLIESVNVNGTKNISELCLEQNKRLIHFSSVHALNQYPLNMPLTEKNPFADENAYIYDRTKAAGERIVLNACKKGLNATILNPTSVLGVRDYKPSYLGQAILKIARGKLPALIPGGFDWVDVKDIVQTAVSTIDKGKPGERYLLSGHWKSLEDLATEINLHTGRKNPIKISEITAKIGLPFIRIFSKLTGQAPLYTSESLEILKNSNKHISSLKAEKELGYKASSFSETVADTINWFKQNGKI